MRVATLFVSPLVSYVIVWLLPIRPGSAVRTARGPHAGSSAPVNRVRTCCQVLLFQCTVDSVGKVYTWRCALIIATSSPPYLCLDFVLDPALSKLD